MTLTDQIKNSTPLQAFVGAGDLVVERIRKGVADIDDAQAAAQARVDALVSELRELPEQLRTLPDKALPAAVETVGLALSQALTAYIDLAERGEHLVDRIRSQQSTKDAAGSARSTTAQAKGTATTAKKAAKQTARTTRKSAEQTAPRVKKAAKKTTATATGSAKKSAKKTSTRAKATTTSARKTAASATKATRQAAKKVGD